MFVRVLKEVQFDKKFEKLPQFNPDPSDNNTPLPKSPCERFNTSYPKKRKHSLGQLLIVSISGCWVGSVNIGLVLFVTILVMTNWSVK